MKLSDLIHSAPVLNKFCDKYARELSLISDGWVVDKETPPALLLCREIDVDTTIYEDSCQSHLTVCLKETDSKIQFSCSLSFSTGKLGVVDTEKLPIRAFELNHVESVVNEFIDAWGLRDCYAQLRAMSLLKPCIEQFAAINQDEGIIQICSNKS
ncbi:hypothetical protein [Vibrio sp. D431a]|uniref:hypothetical protein n=1 Tax=Vibrio sp. D431a TaxID=2837388 RepID=UPI002553ED19|nr:hypothetical protein [Vibrio sp. D431a]MDK9790098.1 hypothetical protein [Vibrio sp. D431a]